MHKMPARDTGYMQVLDAIRRLQKKEKSETLILKTFSHILNKTSVRCEHVIILNSTHMLNTACFRSC